MEEKRTGLFENGLIWFGAGVSIAEILTGTYLAPLGMGKGLAAIIVGHIIGCLMLFLAGVIGGKVRKSAMETVKMSFGQKGSVLFAVLNVLQLVGWTAIMIYDGALAADGVMHTGRWIWCLVIGALIILWIVIGITNLGKINTVAMAALFILTLILCKVIFTGSGAGTPSDDSMTFGAAVELAVAMPLSWLPLISDYTREAKEPVKATAVSAVTYGIVSCWMYVIGMGAAIITGEYDIAQIMLKAGLGILGLLIIVFSTVTTTFLDAYSAGISSETVVSRWNGKHVAIVVTVIGTAAAIVYPMDNITDFLYLIGSVFAPMIAVDSGNTVAADDTNSLRYGMRTDGKRGFVFVNHYQRLTELADIENAVISAENVEFPPIDVKGEVSFFMPFNMKMGDSVLEYATAQPLCKCGETYFFAEIPNIKAEYKFSKGSANIVTVPFENAKYMRKLNGTVYIGGGCNLYEENGQIHSVEDGEYICQKWNGSEFETVKIVQSAKQSNVEITGVENAPFEPKYKEELCIGGERELTWKKINVDGGYGFAEIDYVGDVAQIYADGELVADDYYYGKTWRVPCKLLYGKECYMVISEMKDDFYKEF